MPENKNDSQSIESPQEEKEIKDIRDLKRKMHFKGKVLKTTLAGALVDIGLEIPGVVHISKLSEGTINRVEDVVQAGQEVEVWIRHIVPSKNRIELTMITPLSYEWREIKNGLVVTGKISRLEKYGAFIDFGGPTHGMVHVSEITHHYIGHPEEFLNLGDEVEAKVIKVNKLKGELRLSMKSLEEKPPAKKKKEKKGQTIKSVEEDPTAMELALREAMDRSKQEESDLTEKPSKKESSREEQERDEILARTLNKKVKTK